MPRSDIGSSAALSIYGLLGWASSYLEPALQFALLLAVLIGAILLAYGRWVDARNKRLETRIKLLQIKELEQGND
ncbi:hypothetical protein PsAD5_02339 [Pseudovibrio sp. Ad5]|uniref:hypothetical protein n=1 Tax=Pseudovibrio sp. Ad5 TaxID=989436 RepID=UPI0007AE8C49|nr:hypothetical protein [Pseudovibrio sp. Ad5]KZK97250.1 hypothetical protein PsAD5_02339 [Pseudovibrio sp. Ad5]